MSPAAGRTPREAAAGQGGVDAATSGRTPRTTPVGRTKDAGWEIGVSRTLPVPLDEVWELLISERGIDLWLGKGVDLPREKGGAYRTADGTVGELRGYRPHDRIRLTWRPLDWTHDSTVQVALSAKGDKTVLRFHQERLAGPEERERQRQHWQRVIEQVTDALGVRGGAHG